MNHRSFTLIELIFVIVILGILGGVGSDIIKNAYQNYALQRSISHLQLKTKTALGVLTAHLQSAIHPSVAINNGGTLDYEYMAYITRGGESTIDTTKALVWVGKDTESIRGIWDGTRNYPTYSGAADIQSSDGMDVNLSDSNLENLDDIQDAITNSLNRQAATWDESALYFVYANSDGDTKSRFWNNPTSLFQINSVNTATNIITLSTQPTELSERVYLTYSAYALQYVSNAVDGNLTLTWNFHPWQGETYVDSGTTHVLVDDVTDFEVWGESAGSVIRMRLCLTDQQLKILIDDDTYEFCKEAVVVR